MGQGDKETAVALCEGIRLRISTDSLVPSHKQKNTDMKLLFDKDNTTENNLPSHIWHFRDADQSGPNVLVLGGTHGDELVGIEVVRQILEKLGVLNQAARVFERDAIAGNLFVGFGNPEAIIRRSRGASEGDDLNRSFVPGDLERLPQPNDSLDLKRARELAPLLMKTDFLIDVHSTSSPSKPFICLGKDNSRHREMYRYFPVDVILTDPGNVLVKDTQIDVLGTTDFFVNNYGGSEWAVRRYGERIGTAFCYETGWEKDLSGVGDIVKTIVGILFMVGVVNERFAWLFEVDTERISKSSKGQRVYKLVECVVAQSDGFSYAQGMDKGWREIRRGRKVGCYPNGKCEYIQTGGMYLFPKAAHKVQEGGSLYYIARIAGRP